jgi:hypothetical protein
VSMAGLEKTNDPVRLYLRDMGLKNRDTDGS